MSSSSCLLEPAVLEPPSSLSTDIADADAFPRGTPWAASLVATCALTCDSASSRSISATIALTAASACAFRD
jgi:hypothetical protein